MENQEEKLANLESLRKKLLNKAIFVLVFFGLCTLVGIILFVIQFFDYNDMIYYFVGFVLLIVGVVGMIVGISQLNKKLANAFKEEFDKNYLKEIYGDDFQIFYKKGLSFSYLQQSDVLRSPDHYYSSNLFTSTYKGVQIEGCNYCAEFIHVTTDSKGHTKKVTYSYPGKAYVFTFPRQFKEYFCSFEKGAISEFYRTPSKRSEVEFESVEFNKKFKSYSSDQTFAFYLMTPQVQLSLLEFDEKVKSKIVFVVDGNKLFVFMNNYESAARVSVFKKVSQETLNNYLLELSLPLKLIDDFDVDKNKFLDTSLK